MLLAIENNHNKGQIQRLDIGEGSGLGTKFAIKTISALDGQIQKYSTPKLIAPNERDFYGTQITLPHNQKDLTSKL